jgi:hypothetical protein
VVVAATALANNHKMPPPSDSNIHPPRLNVQQRVARIFAPQSLSILPPSSSDDPLQEEALLQPGDVCLLKTPGAIYSASRSLLSSAYDHAVVALERPDQCLNIAPPTARRIPTCQAVLALREPLVLRPALSPAETGVFVDLCASLVGKPYDLANLYMTLGRSLLEKQLKVGRFLPKVPQGGVVCTDAILSCLVRASPAFRLAVESADPPLDRVRAGAATPNDFVRLTDLGLFQRIGAAAAPRPPAKPPRPTPLERAWTQARTTRSGLNVRLALFVVAFLVLMRRWSALLTLFRRVLATMAVALAAKKLAAKL